MFKDEELKKITVRGSVFYYNKGEAITTILDLIKNPIGILDRCVTKGEIKCWCEGWIAGYETGFDNGRITITEQMNNALDTLNEILQRK